MYIGREPLGGEVIQMNSIESQFNGVLTTFNLTRTVSGVTSAFYPVGSEQLLVSLGGVIQRPDPTGDTGFRISFNQIIFAIAPLAETSCFIISYGNILDVGTPSDNTVGTGKLIDGSVTPIKLSTGGPWWLSNGNVGIGTTNPKVNSKLDVVGSIISTSNSINSFTFDGIAIDKNGSSGSRIISCSTASVGTANISFITRTENGSGTHLTILDSGNVGIGTTNPGYKLEVNGSFAATTKSFVIPHPSKPNYQLRYACLEGPENSIYVRGRTQENIIELPDYWIDLVHEDSITVNLTPVGNKRIWIEEINNNKVYINSEDAVDCHYIVFAERKDVEKLVVEIEEN
jgi:hypothetical protein